MDQICRCDVAYKSLIVGWDKDTGNIGVVCFNRPTKSNSMNGDVWKEFPEALKLLGQRPETRVVIVCAMGRNFCGGLDLAYLTETFLQKQHPAGAQAQCPALLRERFKSEIQQMQDAFSGLEALPCPVIAAVQGACVGAGVDLITAADLRYATADATFCVKEVDLAITADLGTLQRLPKIVGQGVAADLALTARTISAKEAASLGLLSKVYGSYAELMEGALATARVLAAKPPLAVRGTKKVLLHARDHPVHEGLEYVSLWNSAFLLSADMEGLVAQVASRGSSSRRSGQQQGQRSKL